MPRSPVAVERAPGRRPPVVASSGWHCSSRCAPGPAPCAAICRRAHSANATKSYARRRDAGRSQSPSIRRPLRCHAPSRRDVADHTLALFPASSPASGSLPSLRPQPRHPRSGTPLANFLICGHSNSHADLPSTDAIGSPGDQGRVDSARHPSRPVRIGYEPNGRGSGSAHRLAHTVALALHGLFSWAYCLVQHVMLQAYPAGGPQIRRSFRVWSPVLRKPWSVPWGARTASPCRTGCSRPSIHMTPSPPMK